MAIRLAARTAGRWRRKRRMGRGTRRRPRTPPGQGELTAGAPADMATRLPELHARIDDGVAEVDQRVEDDVAAGDEQDRGLEDRVVAGEDRADGVLADAGDGEDLLDDQRAAEQLAGLGPDQGQDRDERILQRVAREQDLLRQPLGAPG